MSKHIRRIALVIAIAICISALVACSDPDGPGGYVPEDGEGERANVKDSLPDSLWYDNETVTVLHREGDWIRYYECTGSLDENDIVYQAVYERNLRVEARLGVKLEFIPTASGGLSESRAEFTQVLSSFIDDYDFFFTTNNSLIVSGLNAYLWDFNSAYYIDFDKPWWWIDCIEELTYDGRTYNFLIGDMCLLNFMKMSAFYFNTRLIEKYLQMTPADFYRKVDAGTWTIDEMNRLVAKCYFDANGNTKKDLGDLYGLGIAGGSSETINQFVFSADYEKYERDASGLQITLKLGNNNDVLALVQKLQSLYHNNRGAFIIPAENGNSGYDSFIIKYFTQGDYVFLAQRFTAAFMPDMRAMEDDYGILPYPTLYEGDPYISYIQGSSSSLAVSYAVDETRFRRACAVMEALNADAYRNVTEKYYNMALKAKNTRDDDSARMVDIIYDTKYKCFLDEYGGKAKGVMNLIYNSITTKNDFNVAYGGVESAAHAQLNGFIIDCKAAYSY